MLKHHLGVDTSGSRSKLRPTKQASSAVDASSADAPDQDGSKASGAHADCAYGHLSAAKTFSTLALVLPGCTASAPALAPAVAAKSHLFERIERPKWHRA